LAFTPDVQSALRWFDATHELTNADGRFWWRRTGLPGPGSMGEQDARLMEAIELLEAAHAAIITSNQQRGTSDTDRGRNRH
jgi:hypothetical protein